MKPPGAGSLAPELRRKRFIEGCISHVLRHRARRLTPSKSETHRPRGAVPRASDRPREKRRIDTAPSPLPLSPPSQTLTVLRSGRGTRIPPRPQAARRQDSIMYTLASCPRDGTKTSDPACTIAVLVLLL